MTAEFICFFPVFAFVGFQVVVSCLKWLKKNIQKKDGKKEENNR